MIGVNFIELCPQQLARIVEWWQREHDDNVRVSFAGLVGTPSPGGRLFALEGLRFELRPAIRGLLEHLPSPAVVAFVNREGFEERGHWVAKCACGWEMPGFERSEATRKAIEHRCGR